MVKNYLLEPAASTGKLREIYDRFAVTPAVRSSLASSSRWLLPIGLMGKDLAITIWP